MTEDLYYVVRNHEHQHSIWLSDREVPAGWDIQSGPSAKEACLEYIRVHWTDITPLSARREPVSR